MARDISILFTDSADLSAAEFRLTMRTAFATLGALGMTLGALALAARYDA